MDLYMLSHLVLNIEEFFFNSMHPSFLLGNRFCLEWMWGKYRRGVVSNTLQVSPGGCFTATKIMRNFFPT